MEIKHPELRRNAVSGAWSLLAVGRSRRPGATVEKEELDDLCPFCPGHEHLTPPAVWIEGGGEGGKDAPGWRIRIIPNLYPALYPEIEGRGWRRGSRRGMPASGYHEVIVHSPHHDRSLADMEPEEAVGVMWAYRTRYRHLEPMAAVRQVLIILNRGREAGASLEHPHTQVFAIPVVPRAVRDELREARRFGGCPLCAAEDEARADGRVVAENGSFVAFTPYASALPYETWIAPRRHSPDFEKIGDGELRDMAFLVRSVLRGVSSLLEDPPYNLYVRSAPCDGGSYDYYHWRVVLIPRITRIGGFELASGIFINIVSPEEAAAQLRESIPHT